MSRAPRLVLLFTLVAALVAVAACGGGSSPLRGGAGAGVNDVNPAARDRVRDGGDLRWPIDSMPDNFNANQFAGATDATQAVLGAVLPTLFTGTADGGLVRDPDYLTSADVTATTPKQTVTYWINPKAVWSDGKPITWLDFQAQWRALNGSNPAYQVAGTTGYDDIESVRPGTSNQQVVVTFTQPYAEWRTLFSPLYPAAVNSDPAMFNTGLADTLPATAGPFELDSVDRVEHTITLRRSDTWWSTPAKLDRILFRVYDRSALPDALADNEIDFYKIGSSVDLLKRAQAIPGVAIRQAPERQYNQITFNGAPGTILADVRLRTAVAQGIDRMAIARKLVGPIVPDVVTLGNRIYPYGSRYYQDNSRALAYDPVTANRSLDALGWTRQTPDGVRSRAGIPLRLRLLEGVPNSIADDIDKTVEEQLDPLGVDVQIHQVPLPQLTTLLRAGDFDLATFAWSPTATPFSSGKGIYDSPPPDDGPAPAEVGQNYGRISSPAVDRLFDTGNRELDDTRRAALGNQLDQLLWQQVHDLPLYPSTGAYAVRADLANFGAPGYADVDYINAGYLK